CFPSRGGRCLRSSAPACPWCSCWSPSRTSCSRRPPGRRDRRGPRAPREGRFVGSASLVVGTSAVGVASDSFMVRRLAYGGDPPPVLAVQLEGHDGPFGDEVRPCDVVCGHRLAAGADTDLAMTEAGQRGGLGPDG